MTYPGMTGRRSGSALRVALLVCGAALPTLTANPAGKAPAPTVSLEDARDTPLCKAIADNQPGLARQLLESKTINVNERGIYVDGFNNMWERTPLIIAAKRGFTDVVELLLSHGADINARDRINNSPLERGSTALMQAVAFNHMDTVQALFAHPKKPDLNLRDRDGASALWLASANENLEMVQFLYGKGAKVNLPHQDGKSVLDTTFMHKKFAVLDFLVSKGADINMVDELGCTPLMTAILSNHSQRAQVLSYLEKFLSFKPELDRQQVKPRSGGDSALMLAAQSGFVEAIKLLLDHGATLNLTSLGTGRTALSTAVLANQPEAVSCLLQRGATTDNVDKAGMTAMTIAVLQANVDMVKLLAKGGAATAARGQQLTPLLAAAANLDPFKQSKCLTIIKILLDSKADINAAASDGRTPLLAAAASSDASKGLETATLLLSKGANPDLANSRGETALMLAAGAGNEKLVKLLLNKDANVQARSGAGETAMAFAQRSGNSAISALLAAKGGKLEAPVAPGKAVANQDLVGTWVGQQDGLPQAQFTLTLKKDNSFDFVSRLTPAALKQLPKGSMNPVIAAQKGTYTLTSEVLVLNVAGKPPLSRRWKLENKVLVLDSIIRLKKTP